MAKAVSELVGLLDLEPLDINLFRGRSPQVGWQRVFGGQVIGQALIAACRTVDGRRPHSLHGYFILPGDPKVPIIYDVERVRDGKSFVTRHVKARQHGATIFTLSCSFQTEEEGFDHQLPMPDVPEPDDLPTDKELKAKILPQMPEPVRQYFERERPIDMRPVTFDRYLPGIEHKNAFNVWIKATAPLPDDPIIHQCVLAYASDMSLLDTSLVPHGRTLFDNTFIAASLDHALWFHRPFRADEWLLYAQDSPSASGARGFARGSVFRKDGTLVASVAQEGLIRPRSR